MAVVENLGSEHDNALRELKEATKSNTKSTLNAKIVTFQNGVHSDIAGDMVDNSLMSNNIAREALHRVIASKKRLDEAKRDAGVMLGGAGKNAFRKQMCRKKIMDHEKEARRMETKLHNMQAKARAASEFLVAKLRKAHAAAAMIKSQNSLWSKSFRLEVSRNATIAADVARNDSNAAKQRVDYYVESVENQRMDARRVADECVAVLGPVKRSLMKPKEEDPDLKGLKKFVLEPEEKPTTLDAMKQIQEVAKDQLKAAIEDKSSWVKHLIKPGTWLDQNQKQQQEQNDDHKHEGSSGSSGGSSDSQSDSDAGDSNGSSGASGSSDDSSSGGESESSSSPINKQQESGSKSSSGSGSSSSS